MNGEPAAVQVDCHQHLWPPALVEALRRRRRAPRLVGWRLVLDGEPDYDVDPHDHDLGARRAADGADGADGAGRVDLALLSLSSPLGIEGLPPEEAEPLLTAWHALADDVGPEHGIWAAVGLVEPDVDALRAHLEHPAVYGLQVPATALATPTSLESLAPVLEVVQAADRPLLVHPGPAPSPRGGTPGWWAALADYPAQQAAAWFAWQVSGRALLPRLRVAFVGLAGLAPLHHERMAARGAPNALDPGLFYETSSYGPDAVGALADVVGRGALVHGTDRPYAGPAHLDPGLAEALRVTNPRRLLRHRPATSGATVHPGPGTAPLDSVAQK